MITIVELPQSYFYLKETQTQKDIQQLVRSLYAKESSPAFIADSKASVYLHCKIFIKEVLRNMKIIYLSKYIAIFSGVNISTKIRSIFCINSKEFHHPRISQKNNISCSLFSLKLFCSEGRSSNTPILYSNIALN